MPALEAGRSSPLGWPIPNALKYWYWTWGLTCWTTWTMPTLLEFAMIPAMVRRSVGWYSASWKVNPSTTIRSGTVYGLIGVSPPCSIAAAAVITFAVLPGSKTSVTGMSVVAATLAGFAGLNDGAWASARI